MNQSEFLSALAQQIGSLPEADRTASLEFYSELIADRMEDGLSEQEAVAGIGTPEEIAAKIIEETPLNTLVRERVRSRRKLRAWEIIALVIGSPLWIAALIVLLTLVAVAYIVLWVLVLVVYIVGIVFALTGVACIPVGVLQLLSGDPLEQVLLIIGAGLVAIGCAILWFFVCKWATIGAARLSRGIARGIKRLFIGRRK